MERAGPERIGHRFSSRERSRTREFEDIWGDVLPAVFSDVAPYYNRASNVASLGLYSRWRRQFVSIIDVRPGQNVLDVCAGTNAVGIGLLDREKDVRVCALDRSLPMQTVGQGIARRLGVRIESVIGDAHRLPFPDDHFDVVTLGWASRHLRILDVLAEIRRALKPGGVFFHCDMLRPKNRIVEELYCAYLKTCVSLTALAFRSGPEARGCRDYFVKAIQTFYSADELSELLAQAGFSDISSKTVPYGVVAFHKATKRALP